MHTAVTAVTRWAGPTPVNTKDKERDNDIHDNCFCYSIHRFLAAPRRDGGRVGSRGGAGMTTQFVINPAVRPIRPEVKTRIHALSEQADLAYAHHVWVSLREADHEGRGAMPIGMFQVDVIAQGEGIFWHESSREPGLLFLRRPFAVAQSLENFLSGAVRNVPGRTMHND